MSDTVVISQFEGPFINLLKKYIEDFFKDFLVNMDWKAFLKDVIDALKDGAIAGLNSLKTKINGWDLGVLNNFVKPLMLNLIDNVIQFILSGVWPV